MAINIDNKGNVDGPDANFEFSHIRDDSSPGSGDGTRVDTLVYGDFHQFFAKIIEQALITYNNVPENFTNGYQYLEALQKLFVQTEPGKKIKTKIIDIGDWNMLANSTVNVTHGLTDHKKIRSINVIVRDDADSNYYSLHNHLASTLAGSIISGGIGTINSTIIVLARVDSEFFDSATFDSIAFNRGWITVEFEE